jgi:hypothetical protein
VVPEHREVKAPFGVNSRTLLHKDHVNRWARGDLDASQRRMIEPSGPKLGSQNVLIFHGAPIDPCFDSCSSFYELWCHAAIISSVPNILRQSSTLQGLHQIRYNMSPSIPVVS